MSKDILIHYKVTKQEDKKIDIKLVIGCIYMYIQNKPIFFKVEPTFIYDVLCFAVVGSKREHLKLQIFLGSDLEKLNCKLEILLTQGSFKKE